MKNSFLNKLKPLALGSAMADMALLLLVFFMATTTTEPPKGVEVELPKGKAQGAEQDSIYISISNKGNIYYEGERLTVEALQSQLILRNSERDRSVSITADKNLDFSQVSPLLDLLREMEFLNVVFMAQSREDN